MGKNKKKSKNQSSQGQQVDAEGQQIQSIPGSSQTTPTTVRDNDGSVRGQGEGSDQGRGEGSGQGRGDGSGRGRGDGSGQGRGEESASGTAEGFGRGRGEGSGRGRGEGFGRGRGEGPGRGRGEGFGRGRGEGPGRGRDEGFGRGRGEGPGRGRDEGFGRGRGEGPGRGRDEGFGRGRGEGPGRGRGEGFGRGRGEGPGRGRDEGFGRGRGEGPGRGRGEGFGRGRGEGPGRGRGGGGGDETAERGQVSSRGAWFRGRGGGDGPARGSLSPKESDSFQQKELVQQEIQVAEPLKATSLLPPLESLHLGSPQKSSAILPTRVGLQIPRRPNLHQAGTKGRVTTVRTNHLCLNLTRLRTTTAYHYDVAIEPDKPKRLLRMALEEFRLRFFPDRFPSFDGRRNLYSASPLPSSEFHGDVAVNDPEMQRQKHFKIVVKFATHVDLTSLLSYMETGTSLDAPQQAIQVLDVVLRCAPANGFVPVGRSYFSPPTGRVESLGNGYEVWYGLFQSVNLGWKPYVNVDVVHKGFPRSQPLINAIYDICGDEVDLNQGLTRFQIMNLEKFLKGLKIDYMLPNNLNSKRTYKVNGVNSPPSTLRFTMEGGRSVSVAQYFEQVKKISLRYRNLPCLHVGSKNRENPIYVPIEFCTVTAGQVTQKKLNERQTANMIKHAATSTEERERKIHDQRARAQFNNSPQVREFGLQVDDKFEEVKARVLGAPELDYGNRKNVRPEKGVWQAGAFLDGKKLTKWTILVLDKRIFDNQISNFVKLIMDQGRYFGMTISQPLPRTIMDPWRPHQLDQFFEHCSNEKYEMVVVVVQDRGSDYANVKQKAELCVGLLTQCIKSTTIRRMNPATAQNILLKVNSKLNGVNHSMNRQTSRPMIFNNPIMIVGADVTHPSPDETDIPSVAAVCASFDPNAFKYNYDFCLQRGKMEIIKDLEIMMKNHLLFFYKQNRAKPQRIFFYRDGVSEGQFQQVLDNELTAIRKACTSLEVGYQPQITFLVVQKRHHTRFFPIKKVDCHGKNNNVMPGTIVDTTITHPTERDFYLVSHASIQGVSRPTKYHCLWDDNNMTEDEMEELTYFLCHLFSRCTRSVSYPAPTYYAHLGAYRARVYLNGKNLSTDKLRTQALKDLQTMAPMYYV